MSFYSKVQDLVYPLGLELSYGSFQVLDNELPDFPTLVYLEDESYYTVADDRNYYKEKNWILEYYFINKNESLEDELEQALQEGGFIFTSTEDIYIKEERIYLKTYFVSEV